MQGSQLRNEVGEGFEWRPSQVLEKIVCFCYVDLIVVAVWREKVEEER